MTAVSSPPSEREPRRVSGVRPAEPLAPASGPNQACILQVWPIRTRDDYLKARAIVDALAVKGETELTEAEADQLEIFSILMQRYEDEHCPVEWPDVTPLEFLALLVRESGLSPSDLGRLLGDRSLGHKILTGDRKLSKAHIKVLSEHFKVNAGAFL
jgi:HTH-type transcriptional regulator/antitoxin HigA